jgi:enoyl-CoA hydratase
MAKEESVVFEQRKGSGYITLNRPDALNALNRATLEALSSALERAGGDPATRAVIVTGAGGKAFSAGADIRFLSQASPLEARDLARLAVRVFARAENLGKVVIAAMNGYALGGGLELAEACTLRIAARGVKLGHPEVRIGAVAGWGGTTRLARLVGRGRAAEMLLTGKTITAEEALNIGLVNRTAESGKLMESAESLAGEILSQAPAAVRLTWEALHRGADISLEESARLGADYFALAAATDDFREGTQAFLHKRVPTFTGR